MKKDLLSTLFLASAALAFTPVFAQEAAQPASNPVPATVTEPAFDAEVESEAANELSIGVGTTGTTIGYARALSRGTGLRVEWNSLRHEGTFESEDATYDSVLDVKAAGLYLDLFPFDSSSFRLTVGAVSGVRQFDLEAQPRNGTITIDGQQYDAEGERMFGTVTWPKTAPYLGIGFGHKASERGLSLVFDLGVIHGSPTVKLDATPSLKQAAGESNIEAERQRVQEEADKAKVYPVIKIGLGYSF